MCQNDVFISRLLKYVSEMDLAGVGRGENRMKSKVRENSAFRQYETCIRGFGGFYLLHMIKCKRNSL